MQWRWQSDAIWRAWVRRRSVLWWALCVFLHCLLDMTQQNSEDQSWGATLRHVLFPFPLPSQPLMSLRWMGISIFSVELLQWVSVLMKLYEPRAGIWTHMYIWFYTRPLFHDRTWTGLNNSSVNDLLTHQSTHIFKWFIDTLINTAGMWSGLFIFQLKIGFES